MKKFVTLIALILFYVLLSILIAEGAIRLVRGAPPAAAQSPTLDLLPLFQEAVAADVELHLRDDGHWTAAGHALAATALGHFVGNAGLIPGLEWVFLPVTVPRRGWSLWEMFVWLVVGLLLFGGLLLIARASVVGPFIYTLF